MLQSGIENEIKKKVKIVLISFISRSGSTLLANNLSKDTRFCVCPEAEILTKVLLLSPNELLSYRRYKKLVKAAKTDHKLKHWNITLPEFHDNTKNVVFFENILSEYRRLNKPDSLFLVFKSEKLEKFQIGSFENYFKIILIRDPRAVYLSQKTSTASFVKTAMNINPFRTSAKTNRLYLSYNDKISNEILIKFEDYICKHEIQNRRLSDFLGLDKIQINDDSELIDKIPDNQKHLHKNVTDQINPNVLDKWTNKLSKYEIYSIESRCNLFEWNIYKKAIDEKINKVPYTYYIITMRINDMINKLRKIQNRIRHLHGK